MRHLNNFRYSGTPVYSCYYVSSSLKNVFAEKKTKIIILKFYMVKILLWEGRGGGGAEKIFNPWISDKFLTDRYLYLGGTWQSTQLSNL